MGLWRHESNLPVQAQIVEQAVRPGQFGRSVGATRTAYNHEHRARVVQQQRRASMATDNPLSGWIRPTNNRTG